MITLYPEEAEPNGVLARECRYILSHWSGLSAFLRVPGAPLDNNKLETMLKYMITHRKNSLFFGTAYSAEYGSRLMSLMVTSLVNGIDAIDYLTQLQIHEPEVWRNHRNLQGEGRKGGESGSSSSGLSGRQSAAILAPWRSPL
ncbi:MAG: transposase [Exilibacterium sp.]